MDFSKIEAGFLTLEQLEVDLIPCLEGVLDLLAARAVEKSIDLAYLCGVDIPEAVISDPTRLQQILINLVGNALKFTEKGGVVVGLSAEALHFQEVPLATEYLRLLRKEGEGHKWFRLEFEIRDTGPGIPQDRLDRLFQAFSQLDPSITRTHGGTGLGLVIAKRLVEAMGGQIWAETVAGAGSSFYFTVISKAAVSSRGANFAASTVMLKGRRVLVIDDSAINRRILEVQTVRWGMIPSLFEKPAEALSWLEAEPDLDVAILDLEMPDMDGYELARKIHSLPKYAGLPLILFASTLPSKDPPANLVADFSVRIVKPIKQADLFTAF